MSPGPGMKRSTPLAPHESANFVTHRLVREDGCWRYRPTRRARVLLGAVSAIGWSSLAAGTLALGSSLIAGLAGVGAGVLLVGLGRRLVAQYESGSVFDLRRRRIEVTAIPRFARTLPATMTTVLRFEQVAAVEVLSKRVHDTDVDFVGFELNLVVDDGRRYNLVDHHDGGLIVSEARAIAGLLDVVLRDQR